MPTAGTIEEVYENKREANDWDAVRWPREANDWDAVRWPRKERPVKVVREFLVVACKNWTYPLQYYIERAPDGTWQLDCAATRAILAFNHLEMVPDDAPLAVSALQPLVGKRFYFDKVHFRGSQVMLPVGIAEAVPTVKEAVTEGWSRGAVARAQDDEIERLRARLRKYEEA